MEIDSVESDLSTVFIEPVESIVIDDAEKIGVIDPERVIENEVINAADCAGLLTSLKSITVNQKSENSIAEAISNLT